MDNSEKADGLEERQERIRVLNDRLRIEGAGGEVVLTSGVFEAGNGFTERAMAAVRGFSDFTLDNDPHGEHDFGAVELEGRRVFWKVDYYDREMLLHSPDEADPAVTRRVLTVMLAEEY